MTFDLLEFGTSGKSNGLLGQFLVEDASLGVGGGLMKSKFKVPY